MKLIGSLTSPYVRKVRVLLLEKQLPFEFIVDSPWESSTHVPDFNPLVKVPALVTDEGETLFDSNILSEYIELLSTKAGSGPHLLPTDRLAALHVRQLVMLADGICDAGINIFLEGRRPADKQYADWVERQRGKIARGIDVLERHAGASTWLTGKDMSLADIATACALLWFDFRVITPDDWRAARPNLAALVARMAQRPSFQQTVSIA
jgi:glutathione S-transferase